MRRPVLISLALVGAAGGCRGMTSDQPPVWVMREMFRQERYNPQSESSFFNDHRTMRTPPEGTVARETYLGDPEVATGRTADNSAYVARVPSEVSEWFAQHLETWRPEGSPAPDGATAMLERGRDRYNIYCVPCHGGSGDGQGVVFRRAAVTGYNFPEPPTFHQDRLRHAPDGQLFATITNGIRNMPSYAAQIPSVYDRWAIVAYVRALQLSQINTRREGAQ